MEFSEERKEHSTDGSYKVQGWRGQVSWVDIIGFMVTLSPLKLTNYDPKSYERKCMSNHSI